MCSKALPTQGSGALPGPLGQILLLQSGDGERATSVTLPHPSKHAQLSRSAPMSLAMHVPWPASDISDIKLSRILKKREQISMAKVRLIEIDQSPLAKDKKIEALTTAIVQLSTTLDDEIGENTLVQEDE